MTVNELCFRLGRAEGRVQTLRERMTFAHKTLFPEPEQSPDGLSVTGHATENLEAALYDLEQEDVDRAIRNTLRRAIRQLRLAEAALAPEEDGADD